MIRDWQKRRSAFNHDWIKNRFMPALAKWVNILDDQVEDPDFEQSFVSKTLPEWEVYREEARSLAKDFEKEMSPMRLFNDLPLSRCSEDTKDWLGDLIHSLWLTRYPVRQWVSEAFSCWRNVEMSYNNLLRKIEDCEDAQSASALRPFRNEFVEFRDSCRNLARAMEKFPGQVKIS